MTAASPATSVARAGWDALTAAWFAPIAALLGLLDVAGSAAIALDPKSTLPGRAVGPLVMLASGCSLFVGLHRYRHDRLRRPAPKTRVAPTSGGRGRISIVAALAFALLIAGLTTGSPLVLSVGALGCLLAAIVLIGGRASRPRPSTPTGTAGALVILGVLPAIGLFWLVVPPLLAIAVIAGVIGRYLNPADRVAA